MVPDIGVSFEEILEEVSVDAAAEIGAKLG
jgi:hypothetical protein